MDKKYFVHESAYVDDGAEIGEGTKVWHFSHILPGAKIGERCIFGQNCSVAGGVVIGDNVKVQNNVSIYTGTTIENDVFLGPSCVLTNVTNPRSQVVRHSLYEETLGWISRHGHRLSNPDADGVMICPESKFRYKEQTPGVLRCLDIDEEAPLPAELSKGTVNYDELKEK